MSPMTHASKTLAFAYDVHPRKHDLWEPDEGIQAFKSGYFCLQIFEGLPLGRVSTQALLQLQ